VPAMIWLCPGKFLFWACPLVLARRLCAGRLLPCGCLGLVGAAPVPGLARLSQPTRSYSTCTWPTAGRCSALSNRERFWVVRNSSKFDAER
jgi:hypothetical protein